MQALKLDPCFTEAWRLVVTVCREIGRPKRATRAMASAAKPDPNPEYKHQAALLWLEAGKPQSALPLLEALSKTPSPRPEWLFGLRFQGGTNRPGASELWVV